MPTASSYRSPGTRIPARPRQPARRYNGQGLSTAIAQAGQREGHWGLVGMKERAEAMGANYLMKSEAGEGTTIQVRLPANVAYTMPVGATFGAGMGLWPGWVRGWFAKVIW